MKNVFIVACIALILQGCSVVMASKQPDKKDMDLLNPGTSRSLLIAEFGPPVHSETQDGTRTDIFRFVQGYSGGAKTGRAVGHAAADVLTLGLWEVVGTPTEGAFDGKEMSYEVSYDKDNRVTKVIRLGAD